MEMDLNEGWDFFLTQRRRDAKFFCTLWVSLVTVS